VLELGLWGLVGVRRMRRRLLGLGIAILLLACGPAPARAAPPAGAIIGRARDALQRALPGARLRLEADDGRVIARTTTDADGRFAFTGVEPGTYAIVGDREGFETATAIATLSATEGVAVDLTLASQRPLDVNVEARRLEPERVVVPPRTGASTYEITSEAIQNQPGAENNSLTQVLLQAPGVSQDASSVGGIHVRNQMGNLQYRINGVALPEGATLFGQNGGLSPRLAASVSLVTGALPAEYGLRTTGVFELQTKSGAFEPGGYLGMYGGSHHWLQPSAEYRGSLGRFHYFVTGDYLENGLGISPATPHGAIHDDTRQGHGFGYFEYLLDSTSKLSVVVGSFVGRFEIPDRPNATPRFTVNGLTSFDSTKVDENQHEQNHFAVLSYLRADHERAVQVALFARYSTLAFRPDPVADLIFNGIAQKVDRQSVAAGLQADGRYVLTPAHEVRAGVAFSAETMSVQTTSSVLPAAGGVQTSDRPFSIFDGTGKAGYVTSLYAQDSWRVLPTVTINAGLRFDDLEAFTSEREVSPRLNGVWTPTAATTAHAGYARYFTPPRLDAISTTTIRRFVGTTNESPVTTNSPPRAERAHYFDAGVTQRVLAGLTVGLDAYYKRSSYHLDEGQFGAPVFLTPFNYRTAQNVGVELTTTYTAGAFSAYGNLAAAQQKARGIATAEALFSPEDLAFIHDHDVVTDHSQLITASAGLAYVWSGTRLAVDLLVGSGLRRTVQHPNDATNPPYEQLNAGLSRRFTVPALGTLEARFDVVNVLDKNYVLRDGTGIGVFARQFGPPRGFFGGLKKEF